LESEKKALELVGVVSVYRNKRDGLITIQPMVRHPTIGAPTEHGASVTLQSLDLESDILTCISHGLALFDEGFDENRKLSKSPSEHRKFNREHDLVRVTRYRNGSLGVLPFRYEDGTHVAKTSNEVNLAGKEADKFLVSALKKAFRKSARILN